MRAPTASLRRGFTLVELLVVIAIIGILVGLLLPAVQAARESGRRIQCANNVKQVSLGLYSYATSQRSFPFGASWDKQTGTWASFILPQLERQAHFDSFDFKKSMGDAANTNAVTLPVNVYVCPTDARLKDAIMTERCTLYGNSYHKGHVLWYTASMGPTEIDDDCKTWCNGTGQGLGSFCCQGDNHGSNGGKFAGIFARYEVAIKPAAIRDGLSNTILIGETLPKHCFHNTAFGRNSPTTSTYIPMNHMNEGQVTPGMSQQDLHAKNSYARTCGFKSKHPGGATFAMADGSVHFFSEYIDYKLFNGLGTRAGGEAVSPP